MSATTTFTMADLDAAERDLTAVDRAVQLLEDGQYGMCTVCGVSLAVEVTNSPLTFTCEEHSGDQTVDQSPAVDQ
jgi:hypothetical protein